MGKFIGYVLLSLGLLLFVSSFILMIPVSDNLRIPLILIALAVIAIEALTKREVFLEKISKFSIGYLIVLLVFLSLFAYAGYLNIFASLALPLVLLIVGLLLLIVGSYVVKRWE